MSTTPKCPKWYHEAIQLCFPTQSVSDVSFLKIFAAPVCAPCSQNYGKRKVERQRGISSKKLRLMPEKVLLEQKKLLRNFQEQLEAWNQDDPAPKKRLDYLASHLIGQCLDRERLYLGKNSSYSPTAFLSFYANVSEMEAVENFELLCSFYAAAVETIFREAPEELAQRYQAVKEAVSRKLPQYTGAETGHIAPDMGRQLAIVLLCLAENEPECACTVLGLDPPSERNATLSVFSLSKVELKSHQFNRICAAALRADPDPEELQSVYEILMYIQDKTLGNPDGETRMLIRSLEAASQKCLERLTKALLTAKSAAETTPLLQKIGVVTDIRNQCEAWQK